MKNLNVLFLSIFSLLILVMTGCADALPIEQASETGNSLIQGESFIPLTGDPYGFFSGLWHGFIVLFSFIGSLFSDDIAVYAVNNTGGFYDLGFALGVGAFSGGASAST